MRFFPKSYTLKSEKNGIIEVREFWWWVVVYAGGFEQSGPYVTELWRRAVQKVRRPRRVTSVLLLGLCVGDNVRIAQARFPNAQVTAIEWDQAMIDLALSLHRFKKTPQIIHGDIREVLPTLTEKYDVILSDAFYGDKPDVGADGNTVGESLSRILSPDGCYILNSSRTSAATEYISKFLTFKKKWRFRDNTVAMFVK